MGLDSGCLGLELFIRLVESQDESHFKAVTSVVENN